MAAVAVEALRLPPGVGQACRAGGGDCEALPVGGRRAAAVPSPNGTVAGAPCRTQRREAILSPPPPPPLPLTVRRGIVWVERPLCLSAGGSGMRAVPRSGGRLRRVVPAAAAAAAVAATAWALAVSVTEATTEAGTAITGDTSSAPTTKLAAVSFASLRPSQRSSSVRVFTDVSAQAGLPRESLLKYGGPLVADVNDDGVYDLVLPTHNQGVLKLWYGKRGGTYQRGVRILPYTSDVHGVAAGDTNLDGTLDLLVTLGGAFGRLPRPPVFFRRTQGNKYTNSTDAAGLSERGGRGRSPRFVDLDGDGDLDIILFHYTVLMGSGPRQVVFENTGKGTFTYRPGTGLENGTGEQMLLTDMDGDGDTDLVSFPWFRLYERVGPFQFQDKTWARVGRVTGPSNLLFPTFWVVELDFDNDGKWDLFVVRGTEPDVLLRNLGNRYQDVTARSGLIDWAVTTGATVADFDNDGYEDLLVFRTALPGSETRPPDVLYWNRGDGTFEKTIYHGAQPPLSVASATGDSGQAFDVNGDGRVDVLVGYGDRDDKSRTGPWRLYRNVLPWCDGCADGRGSSGSLRGRRAGHWLAVRVRRSWTLSASAAGAVVTVRAGGVTRRRRVGPAGASNHQSQLSVVHFGLGYASFVDFVEVRWSDGTLSTRRKGVRAGRVITFGQ
ncbi:hypothetical protein MMPV_002762 [Pyropia vietnamensis]